jgi:SAM-dependent methyltransferase
MVGYPPQTAVGAGNPEAIKYGRLWAMPEYRDVAPGEVFATVFLQQARPRHGSHVIDFGCGTGRGAVALHDVGLKVTMLDFARNCLDDAVRERISENFAFKKHDLENPSPVIAEYGFCTDVMEHIPLAKAGLVLDNILRAAKHCFFSISTQDDIRGDLIGEKLHLTVQPYEWWMERFRERHCVIHWSEELSRGYSCFYVTVWENAQVLVDNGEINATEEQIRENIRHNVAQGWQQVEPHPQQEIEVMIVGGGPSLKDFEDDIRDKRKNGVKLVTLNGAYNWCLERGIIPSATIVVDAREFNARFTKPILPECKYLLASQCHPSVIEGLPREQTYLWHVMGDLTDGVIKDIYSVYWPVPGGSTVLLRAIPLLRMLGFRKFHLYGCDSCLSDGQHHAFSQPENDDRAIVPIMVTGGRVFYCHPWMASQGKEFITLVEKLGDTFDMIVYGDGLLAHIINTGAQIAPETEE